MEKTLNKDGDTAVVIKIAKYSIRQFKNMVGIILNTKFYLMG